MLESLNKEWIKGAALDVLQKEHNISRNNKLIQYSINNMNLIIVPHIGGNTYESTEKTEIYIAKKLVKHVCSN